jgi:hypothetical protein
LADRNCGRWRRNLFGRKGNELAYDLFYCDLLVQNLLTHGLTPYLNGVAARKTVQPFLVDAPRCRLLTTLRKEVVKPTGTQENSLDVLDPEEAWSLLARSSGAARENLKASAIIEECGRLPLALAMIGALVRGETRDAWAGVLRAATAAADLDKICLQFPSG